MPALARNPYIAKTETGLSRRDKYASDKSCLYVAKQGSFALICRKTGSQSIRSERRDIYTRPTAKQWQVFNITIVLPSVDQELFDKLCEQWRNDTLYDSSLAEISFHPAYQTIMAMGDKALPFILRDLERRFGHWFYALNHIVRLDVAEGASDLEEARRRWLEWGRRTKLLK